MRATAGADTASTWPCRMLGHKESGAAAEGCPHPARTAGSPPRLSHLSDPVGLGHLPQGTPFSLPVGLRCPTNAAPLPAAAQMPPVPRPQPPGEGRGPAGSRHPVLQPISGCPREVPVVSPVGEQRMGGGEGLFPTAVPSVWGEPAATTSTTTSPFHSATGEGPGDSGLPRGASGDLLIHR